MAPLSLANDSVFLDDTTLIPSTINLAHSNHNNINRICVCVRMRPLNSKERQNNDNIAWLINEKKNNIEGMPSTIAASILPAPGLQFDSVYDMHADTDSVYNNVGKGIVEGVMNGYNGTIFCYGQTSSGKTYTMQGDDMSLSSSNVKIGIIQMAIRDIFAIIAATPSRDYTVRVSYIEIYKEQIQDLLVPPSGRNKQNKLPKVREDIHKGVILTNVVDVVCSNEYEIINFLKNGQLHRHVGTTNMNERSSRSHSIFRVTVESSPVLSCASTSPTPLTAGDDELMMNTAVRYATLNLVDLAGSERQRLTGAEGDKLKEGGQINASLLTLSRVIFALSSAPASANNNNTHVPYRDSKLTRILQPALGGNSRTVIICTIAPPLRYLEESKSTLLFASRAKAVVNHVEINETVTDQVLINKYRQEIKVLKLELQRLYLLKVNNNITTTSISSGNNNSNISIEEDDGITLGRGARSLSPFQENVETCIGVEDDDDETLCQSKIRDLQKFILNASQVTSHPRDVALSHLPTANIATTTITSNAINSASIARKSNKRRRQTWHVGMTASVVLPLTVPSSNVPVDAATALQHINHCEDDDDEEDEDGLIHPRFSLSSSRSSYLNEVLADDLTRAWDNEDVTLALNFNQKQQEDEEDIDDVIIFNKKLKSSSVVNTPMDKKTAAWSVDDDNATSLIETDWRTEAEDAKKESDDFKTIIINLNGNINNLNQEVLNLNLINNSNNNRIFELHNEVSKLTSLATDRGQLIEEWNQKHAHLERLLDEKTLESLQSLHMHESIVTDLNDQLSVIRNQNQQLMKENIILNGKVTSVAEAAVNCVEKNHNKKLGDFERELKHLQEALEESKCGEEELLSKMADYDSIMIEYDTEIKSVNKEIEKANEEKSMIESKLKSAVDENQVVLQKLYDAQSHLTHLTKQVHDLQILNSQQSNDQMKELLDEIHKKNIEIETLTLIKNDLDVKIQSFGYKLQQSMEINSELERKMINLDNQYDRLQQEEKSLSLKYHTLIDDKSNLERHISILNSEKSSILNALTTIQSDMKMSENKVTYLNQTYEELTLLYAALLEKNSISDIQFNNEINKLKLEIESACNSHSTRTIEMESLLNENTRMKTEVNQLNVEIDNLKLEIESLKHEHDSQSGTTVELETLSTENRRIKSEMSHLNDVIDNLKQDLSRETNEWRERYSNILQSNDSKELMIQQLQSQGQTIFSKESDSKTITELKSQTQSLSNQIASLNQSLILERQKNQNNENNNKMINDNINKLINNKNNLEMELKEIKEKYETLCQSSFPTTAGASKDTGKSDMQRGYEIQLDSLKQSYSDIIHQYEAEKAVLMGDLNSKTNDILTYQTKIEFLTSTVATFDVKSIEFNNEMKEIKQKVCELEAHVASLSEEKDLLLIEINHKKNNCVEPSQIQEETTSSPVSTVSESMDLTHLTAEINTLQNNLNKANADLEALEEDFKISKNQVQSLKNENNKLLIENDMFKESREYANVDNRMVELLLEIKTMKDNHDEIVSELNNQISDICMNAGDKEMQLKQELMDINLKLSEKEIKYNKDEKKNSNKIKKYELKIQDLTAQNEQMEIKLKSLEKTSSEALNRLKYVDEEKKIQDTQIIELKNNYSKVDKLNNDNVSRLLLYQEEKCEMKSQYNRMFSMYESLTIENHKLKMELESGTNQQQQLISSLKNENNMLIFQNMEINNEKNNLNNCILDINNKYEMLNTQVKSNVLISSSEMEELRSSISLLQHEKLELQKEKNEVTLIMKDQQLVLQQAENDLSHLNITNDTNNNRILKLNSDVQDLLSQKCVFTTESNNQMTAINTIHSSMETLNMKMINLSDQLIIENQKNSQMIAKYETDISNYLATIKSKNKKINSLEIEISNINNKKNKINDTAHEQKQDVYKLIEENKKLLTENKNYEEKVNKLNDLIIHKTDKQRQGNNMNMNGNNSTNDKQVEFIEVLNTEISSLKNKISVLNNELSTKKLEKASESSKLSQAEQKIFNKKRKIENLKKQLSSGCSHCGHVVVGSTNTAATNVNSVRNVQLSPKRAPLKPLGGVAASPIKPFNINNNLSNIYIAQKQQEMNKENPNNKQPMSGTSTVVNPRTMEQREDEAPECQTQ